MTGPEHDAINVGPPIARGIVRGYMLASLGNPLGSTPTRGWPGRRPADVFASADEALRELHGQHPSVTVVEVREVDTRPDVADDGDTAPAAEPTAAADLPAERVADEPDWAPAPPDWSPCEDRDPDAAEGGDHPHDDPDEDDQEVGGDAVAD